MMDSKIQIPFIEIKQPIGTFYICSISWQDLIAICYNDIREIRNTENDIDSYLGIQRAISEKRIKEISQYVTTMDATFPTSVILHINSESYYKNGNLISDYDEILTSESYEIETNISLIENSNLLEIRKNDQVAKILDGQHRIEGLKSAVEKDPLFFKDIQFQINVTIFVDLDIDDQAQIFSVINKAQTKVNKSLVYDLYEYAKYRSPQKTAHDVVRLLYKKENSPFYRKIKILGTARFKETETITQATIAELIISYITDNAMRDRDALKRKGSALFSSKKGIEIGSQSILKKRPLRKMFVEKDDAGIFLNINNFFDAARNKWPQAWDNHGNVLDNNILNKSTGIIALFRVFRDVYNSLSNTYQEVHDTKAYQELFNKVHLVDEELNRDNYLPGSSGQGKLYRELVESMLG